MAPDTLAAAAGQMRAAAEAAGRDPSDLEVVLRLVDTAGRAAEVARALPALADAGVDEIVVNVDWEHSDAAEAYARMRA